MFASVQDMLATIQRRLEDADADECLINGARGWFFAGPSGVCDVSGMFASHSHEDILEFTRELVWSQGQRLDPFSPSAGGVIDHLQLRWHVMIRPLVQDEWVLSLRRHRFQEIAWQDYGLGAQQERLFADVQADGCPLVICGATGAGKTTFLVSMMQRYFVKKRVLILESLAEIPPLSPYWVRMTEVKPDVAGRGGVTLEAVGREALRLRPDALVVGELRGSEAEVFLDMSLTGHGSCATTLHASSVASAVKRLQRLAPHAARCLAGDLEILYVVLKRDQRQSAVVEMKRMRMSADA